MKYIEFAKNPPPVLYGQITTETGTKIGQFKLIWGKWNGLYYAYHTPKGNKGSGGFTLKKAYHLFIENRITTNPKDGNPENYI